MNPLNLDQVCQYVNANIVHFHERRLASLENLTLDQLLTKNPYLLKAKHITTAAGLIENLLQAFLSSSEEKPFGDFLEGLALFVASQTCGGHKSTAQGVDLEFIHNNTHYVVSIKSGPNWGNSSQHRKLAQDLTNAVNRVRQSRTTLTVQPVLGICYGKTRTTYTRDGYLKVVSQNFWYLISENKTMYTDIVEPIGHRAREHNEAFDRERAQASNRLTRQFMDRFCNEAGAIDWVKLVEFSCGNYDLDKVLPK